MRCFLARGTGPLAALALCLGCGAAFSIHSAGLAPTRGAGAGTRRPAGAAVTVSPVSALLHQEQRPAAPSQLCLALPLAAAATSGLAALAQRRRGGGRGHSRLQLRAESDDLLPPSVAADLRTLAVTVLRISAGIMMIHHGTEGGTLPAQSPEALKGFTDFIVKPYLSWLPLFDSYTWSIIHDYTEFVGAWLLLAGLFTRFAAAALFGTMGLAVYFHLASTGLQGFPFGHVENYSYNFEEPVLYAAIFLFFVANGAGPLSLDSLIKGKSDS